MLISGGKKSVFKAISGEFRCWFFFSPADLKAKFSFFYDSSLIQLQFYKITFFPSSFLFKKQFFFCAEKI